MFFINDTVYVTVELFNLKRTRSLNNNNNNPKKNNKNQSNEYSTIARLKVPFNRVKRNRVKLTTIVDKSFYEIFFLVCLGQFFSMTMNFITIRI